jgi:SAM-dependent methyltransferase
MPMHSEEQLDAFAAWEREAWETRADAYAADLTALTGPGAQPLLDEAGVGAGTTVLDVATGPGVVAQAALARFAEVTAVDQSAPMVAIARSHGIDARVASADALPFDDGAFEAVVAGFLLNHLARPEAVVAELARVCRGRVALSVWDVPDRNAALGLFGPVAADCGVTADVPPGPDPARYADEAQARELLAGLSDVRVHRVSWTVEVDPGAWFDAVGASTPRTGAVISAATPEQRAALRARYLEVAARYAGPAGRVVLPAAAVVLSGRT